MGSCRGWKVLRDLDQKRLTTEAAAQLLGLERRQVFRLLKTYRIAGAAGLISKRRGCSSNRRKPEALRAKALALIRERYWDFGPSLAAEKLREVHRPGKQPVRFRAPWDCSTIGATVDGPL